MMLKAKISQIKSNLCVIRTTKYDTTHLELSVETADNSPWIDPEFELLGIKSDGHEVYQTDNFQIIDLNHHIVRVTLNEQFVTCDGNVDMQLVVKNNDRKSSTPFKLVVGRSLSSEILESHRDVKVLDDLENYIIEGRKYILNASELAQDTANNTQIINITAQNNESQRIQQESTRQTFENQRKEDETLRKNAETLRIQHEEIRQSNEVERMANEQIRLENESNRINNENDRENNESNRQTQEQKRHTSESTRQSQEAARQSQEVTRQSNENNRNQEEATRINNEAAREQAEDTRKSQELDRQSAESIRRTSETNRNNAESTRTQNENTRQSQETSRITNEQNRVQQEQERVSNENTRKTEEAKRVEAEELRKEAYTEATQLLEELRNFESITENDRTDYMGSVHQTLKAKNDADVDWLLGEINTVHYDGQHITATDSIEGRSKSAILSGNTLVNIPTTYNRNPSSNGNVMVETTNLSMLKSNTKYLLKIINKSNYNITYYPNTNSFIGNDFTVNGKSEGYVILTSLDTTLTHNGIVRLRSSSETIIDLECAILFIEYKDGMENWDIPYFEGMQSVKMPVLTTSNEDDTKTNILTTSEEVELRGIGDVKDELNLITGELTQRIGEIVLDGVSEVVDGERWSTNTDLDTNVLKFFYITNKKINGLPVKVDGSLINDKFISEKTSNRENIRKTNTECLIGGDKTQGMIQVFIKKDRLTEISVNGFRQWLSQNPITVNYEITTGIVKTVDLSDNHVYSYKGTTHYDCSSAEGSLVPTLSVDVPTNLPALVSRQRATIMMQKNQIKLLEETNSELIISQETQDEEIVTNMLASVELFEMVLSMTPLSIDMSKFMEVNPMVEVYVTLILKGEKTIEQVPTIIRDKVQAQLDLLTK